MVLVMARQWSAKSEADSRATLCDDTQKRVVKQLLAARNLTLTGRVTALTRVNLLFLLGFDEGGVVVDEDDDE
jgi:hypothetical protein